MAILKFVDPKKYKAKGIKNITAYVLRLSKKAHNDGLDKPDKLLAWGVNVDPHRAADQMEATKDFWKKHRGREYYHFIMSYPPDESISLRNALRMGRKFVETCIVRNKDGTNRKIFKGYEVLIAAHHDKDNHIDVHFIINSVSFSDGRKFRYTTREGTEMKQFQNEMNRAAGYKRAPEKGENYKYEKRTGIVENRRNSYEFLLKAEKCEVEAYIKNCANAVLAAIKAKPGSREEFINKMNENGFATEWTDNRKHITFTDKARKNDGEIKCKVRLAKLFDIYNFDEFKKEYIEAEIEKNSKSVIQEEKHTEETKEELVESVTVEQISKAEAENTNELETFEKKEEQEILKMPEIDEEAINTDQTDQIERKKIGDEENEIFSRLIEELKNKDNNALEKWLMNDFSKKDSETFDKASILVLQQNYKEFYDDFYVAYFDISFKRRGSMADNLNAINPERECEIEKIMKDSKPSPEQVQASQNVIKAMKNFQGSAEKEPVLKGFLERLKNKAESLRNSSPLRVFIEWRGWKRAASIIPKIRDKNVSQVVEKDVGKKIKTRQIKERGGRDY